MSRTRLIAVSPSIRFPDCVPEAPGAVRLFPKMVGTPAVEDLVKFNLVYSTVFQEFIKESFGELSVVPLDKGNSLFASDLIVPNLVSGVRRRAADPELDVC